MFRSPIVIAIVLIAVVGVLAAAFSLIQTDALQPDHSAPPAAAQAVSSETGR